MSDQRSSASTAADPVTAPPLIRASPRASSRTLSRTRARWSVVNIPGGLYPIAVLAQRVRNGPRRVSPEGPDRTRKGGEHGTGNGRQGRGQVGRDQGKGKGGRRQGHR